MGQELEEEDELNFDYEFIERSRGRPPKLRADEKTLVTVANLSALQCTYAEAAGILRVSVDSFRNFIRNNKAGEDAWVRGKETGKVSLRRTQFVMAKKSAAMAIWLGKQYLGQREPKEQVEIGLIDGAPSNLEHGMADGVSALLLSARMENSKLTTPDPLPEAEEKETEKNK